MFHVVNDSSDDESDSSRRIKHVYIVGLLWLFADFGEVMHLLAFCTSYTICWAVLSLFWMFSTTICTSVGRFFSRVF